MNHGILSCGHHMNQNCQCETLAEKLLEDYKDSQPLSLAIALCEELIIYCGSDIYKRLAFQKRLDELKDNNQQ